MDGVTGLTSQEVEMVSWLVSKHWAEFFAQAEECMTVAAIHRLAEKLGLAEVGQ